jgi:hypothetical protein
MCSPTPNLSVMPVGGRGNFARDCANNRQPNPATAQSSSSECQPQVQGTPSQAKPRHTPGHRHEAGGKLATDGIKGSPRHLYYFHDAAKAVEKSLDDLQSAPVVRHHRWCKTHTID